MNFAPVPRVLFTAIEACEYLRLRDGSWGIARAGPAAGVRPCVRSRLVHDGPSPLCLTRRAHPRRGAVHQGVPTLYRPSRDGAGVRHSSRHGPAIRQTPGHRL